MSKNKKRKLAAIVAIDVVGFSRLMHGKEAETLQRVNGIHRKLVQPTIQKHHGRVVKLMGDGLLAEFASVVQSVQCAAEIQTALLEKAEEAEDQQPLKLRIGINFGDIIAEGGDIFGEGVIIASRLEALADPGGFCISGKVHDEIHDRLDLPFEDMGDQQVKNIDRPIRVWRWSEHEPVSYSIRTQATQPQRPSNRPTIAVLPFESLGGPSDHDYFADGIAEDVTTELSRFGSLSVISRHSAFKYRNNKLDIAKVGVELGAQFLLSGSVRRNGPRVRITVQLTETENDSNVWAERFDRDAEDLFAIQDEITEKVASTAAGKVRIADTERARRKSPSNLLAYDYFLRGLDLHKGGEDNLATSRKALSMFDKAIELDDGFARAHAWRACAFACTWGDRRTDAQLEQALESVQKALSLDAGESEAHRILGAIYLDKREFIRAEKHFVRAGALNPNDADIMAQTANFFSFVGKPNEALSFIRRAMDLNPHHADWYWTELGLARFAAGECSDAIDAILNRASPTLLDLELLVASCSEEGRVAEAGDYAQQLAAIDSGITIEKVLEREPFQRTEDTKRLVRGLQSAGIPLQ